MPPGEACIASCHCLPANYNEHCDCVMTCKLRRLLLLMYLAQSARDEGTFLDTPRRTVLSARGKGDATHAMLYLDSGIIHYNAVIIIS